MKPYIELEKKARKYFEDPRNNTTNDTTKKSFTYLLLDPKMTKNLPAKTKTLNINKQWTTFIDSIFYVGKGKRSIFLVLPALSSKHLKKKPIRVINILFLRVNSPLGRYPTGVCGGVVYRDQTD